MSRVSHKLQQDIHTSSSTCTQEDMEPQQANADVSPGIPKQKRPKEAFSDRLKACITCRSRKTRCDGGQPICQACLNSNRTCEYSTERPRPSGPRSAAVLSAYVARLEEKLQNLLPAHPGQPVIASRTTHTTPLPQPNIATGSGHHKQTITGPSPKAVDVKLPPEDQDKIFTMYFKYQYRLVARVNPSHFAQALEAEDENLRPHPALIDGILLLGIMLGQLAKQSHLLPSVLPDTDHLVSQIHRKLGRSIELGDRLFDHIQASLLLCCYYFYNGRLQEAQYFSTLTFQLAIVVHLHQIDRGVLKEDLSDERSPSFWDGTILGRPRDRDELYTRILFFWDCYFCERLNSLITGLPAACDEVTITTVWPQSAEEFELNGFFAPNYPHSIQDLFAGRIVLMKPDECMMPVLLGRATQLVAITGSLEPEDRTALDRVIQDINTFTNAVQVYDSTLCHLDKDIPPYHSIKSCPDGKAWCIALQALLGVDAIRVHLLRSIETAHKLLILSGSQATTSTDGGIEPQTFTSFITLVPRDGGSFLDRRFAFARRGIKLLYEVARQHVEDDPLGFASTKWLTHLPNVCGFLLPSLLLAVVELIRDLEARRRDLPATETVENQTLSNRLEDVETTFAQGMQVMHLLSQNMAILKFQIDKLEQARRPI